MADTGSSAFLFTFSDALREYKKRIKIDLLLHPLAVRLQLCDSPLAVISVLQEQARAIDQSLTKLLHPTVNVIYALSSSLQEGLGLVLSPANVIFVGFGVLFSEVQRVGASQDVLINILGRMEQIFQRVEPSIKVSSHKSVEDKTQEILLAVLSVLTNVTESITQGRAKKYFKKLLGRDVVEHAFQSLGQLLSERAQMSAAAEGSNIGHVDNSEVIPPSGQELEVIVSDDANDINSSSTHSSVINAGSTSRPYDQLRRWISPPDPSLNHNIMRSASHMGTGRWFLQSTVCGQWKSTPASPLLWVHGRPGSGKSVLCSAIIDDIRVISEAGLATMAYFYFDFRDIHKQHLRDVISTLLFQLSMQSILYRERLHSLYSTHHDGAQKPSDGVLTECLKDMLSMPSKVPVYVIMDAIDECPHTSQDTDGVSPREEILDFVEDLVELRLPNLRLCVTSRAEIDIRVALEPLSSFQLSLHDETGQVQDIDNYVRSFIASNRNMRRLRKQDKELFIRLLVDRANGSFRWVFCQLETLRYVLPQGVRRALDEMPDTLDDTYERILMGINLVNRNHARRLFQCLAVARRPLRIEELDGAIAVDPDAKGATPRLNVNWGWEDQEQAVLFARSSLVEVVNIEDSKIVMLSHFSVKEFLTSDRLTVTSEDVRDYHVLLKSAHTTLARACLDVLLQLGDHFDLNNVGHFPLADYAAKHWVGHVRSGNVTSQIQEKMKLLFDPGKPHFANWVSIYDMDEHLGSPTPHPIRPNAALYYAALCGLDFLAEWLISELHMDVNSRGGYYVTAIQAALYKRHLSIVRLLIDNGVDVNTQYDDGSNLLQIAAQIGDPDAVSLLQSRGAGLQSTDSNYSPLFFMALRNGNLTEARQLLSHGVDVNARDKMHATALHISSDNGDVNFVEVLFQYGAEVDPQNCDGSTPLHLASAKGNSAVVRLLMEHGADVNALDNKNTTPLNRAFAHQNLDIAVLLIEKDANVKLLDDKVTPLHSALAMGNAKLVKQLIQRGVDVNGRDKNNSTPLHLASAKGDTTAIELLINDVDLDVVDNAKSTPLHLALVNGNLDVAETLVKKGADVNVSDNKNQTPLHLLLPNKNFGLVELLVELGANVNTRGDNNSTPLHLASRHGPCETVDLLLKHGADPNMRDNSGSTPLHIASQLGAIEIVEHLLKGGAKVNLTDGNRNTPLHLASNDKKMARLLIRYGANAFALDKNKNMPFKYA